MPLEWEGLDAELAELEGPEEDSTPR